jgi:hypothetical protein
MAPTRNGGGEFGEARPPEGQSLGRDTQTMLSAIENLSANVSVSLRDGVDRRPVASLGLAFAAGYILGGGLTLRLGTFLMAAAGRALVASSIAAAVGGFARGQVEART